MTTVNERINVYTILSTVSMPSPSWDTLLLVDHVDVPEDEYIIVTPDSIAAELTASTDHLSWAQVYFSQQRCPTRLILGRWKAAGSTPAEAYATLAAELDGEFWAVALLGSDATGQAALAAAVEASKKHFYMCRSAVADVKNPAVSTDIASVCQAASYKRTAVLYSEHTDIYGMIDAAILGQVLPGDPGSVAFSWQQMAGIWQSGKSGTEAVALTAAERTALEAKNANYCETLSGVNLLRKGISSAGVPINLQLGADWFSNGIQSDVFSFFVAADNPSFNEETLGIIEGVVKQWLDRAVAKSIILNTVDFPIVYNFPAVSSFSKATKATGTMTLPNVWRATLNFPVQNITIYGTWQL